MDSGDNSRLVESLTKLDVLVKLFSEGKISENDILYYVLASREEIVSGNGAYLVETISLNGKVLSDVKSDHLDMGVDLSRGFLDDVIHDNNNPVVRPRALTITPRPQGG